MNSTVDRIDSTRIELQRKGRLYTGIKISPGSRPDIWNLRTGNTRDTAWIYRDGSIEEWPVEGYIENQGRYCIGPRFDGERFSRYITSARLDLPCLRKVLYALMQISTVKEEPGYFDPSSVFLLSDGAVLVLSSSLAEKQRRCFSEEELLQNYELFKHPDMKAGAAALVYSFALLAYIVVTGEHPFLDRPLSAKDIGEELRERMRRSEFVPLSLMSPEAYGEATLYIDSILEGSEDNPDVAGLYEFLSEMETEPAPILSQADILRMSRRARGRKTRINRKIFLRRFFRRYKISLAIAGILLAVGTILTANIMQKASLPPPTRGLEAEQVVRLFYECMNRLDHETMEACTSNGAGSRYIESVVRLTVITRVTKAYSVGGPPPFLSAREWIDSGLPPLERGQFVFGTADISLRETADGEFLVRYIFAQPAAADMEEQEESIRIVLSEHTERVRIRGDKEDNRIYSMETEEIREIDSFRKLKNE